MTCLRIIKGKGEGGRWGKLKEKVEGNPRKREDRFNRALPQSPSGMSKTKCGASIPLLQVVPKLFHLTVSLSSSGASGRTGGLARGTGQSRKQRSRKETELELEEQQHQCCLGK